MHDRNNDKVIGVIECTLKMIFKDLKKEKEKKLV